MVVSQDGKTATRPVTIGSQSGDSWVVLSGLKAGEMVVVDGFQKLQMMPPGTPVKPVPWTPPPSTQAAPATASR
jgi:membrane fusion protein (multidrug efflux system)